MTKEELLNYLKPFDDYIQLYIVDDVAVYEVELEYQPCEGELCAWIKLKIGEEKPA